MVTFNALKLQFMMDNDHGLMEEGGGLTLGGGGGHGSLGMAARWCEAGDGSGGGGGWRCETRPGSWAAWVWPFV
jgi:hypothetical protein